MVSTQITTALSGEKKSTGGWGKLEGGRNGRGSIGLNLDTLADKDVIDIFHFKARNTASEKGIALGELMFEMFSVATESESLAMPVFLVTGGSGGSTGGASRMLRVALERRKERSKGGE